MRVLKMPRMIDNANWLSDRNKYPRYHFYWRVFVYNGLLVQRKLFMVFNQ